MMKIYEQVKLILQRLNGEWSITGDTLSPNASLLLRREVVEESIADSVADLAAAYAYMITAAAAYIDPASGNHDAHCDGANIARWNGYFGAAGDALFFGLIDSLEEAEHDKVMMHFKNALQKAQATKQLVV